MSKKNNFCTKHVLNLYVIGKINEQSLVSYSGLTDAGMRAPEKDVPVHALL